MVTLAVAVAIAAVSGGNAFAHAADRGHVLLLPTGFYRVGGALAVALSFLVLFLVPPTRLQRFFSASRSVTFPLPDWRLGSSLAGTGFLIFLLSAGVFGSRDPLSNPLPLFIWTVFWVGLTLTQAVVGDVWRWINPWYGPWRVVICILRRLVVSGGYFQLPQGIGYAPAILFFLAFAWFELVYPAPDDPWRLALAVGSWWLLHLAFATLFGWDEWSRRGEPLTAFLSMVAKLAPFDCISAQGDGKPVLRLGPPAAKLLTADPLPPSGAAFLLVVLGTVSFDGLMRTFAWLGLFGVNPLEYPGRTAMVGINSLGLIGVSLALVAVYFLAVAAGFRMAGLGSGRKAAGAMVWSILPISLAYHFSHYLTAFALNIQYALAAISDPLASGWDLFGTAGLHVTAGLTLGAQQAWLIWNLQAAAIVLGHVLAVIVAHGVAARFSADARTVTLSQAPLAALMVAYTVLGLWLLSSPTAG